MPEHKAPTSFNYFTYLFDNLQYFQDREKTLFLFGVSGTSY